MGYNSDGKNKPFSLQPGRIYSRLVFLVFMEHNMSRPSPFKAEDDVAKASVGSSFDAAKKATLSLDVDYRESFFGSWEGVWIYVSSIASSPTKLTCRICTDANGDDIVITDTQADLSVGITTATKGSVVYKIDLPIVLSTQTVYLFAKTDTGTVTIDKVVMTWRR